MGNEQLTMDKEKTAMRRFICCLLLLSVCPLSWGFDFGLLLDQNADLGGSGFGYSGTLLPRFSVPLGDTMNVYVSAGINASSEEGGLFALELLRTEFTYRVGIFDLKAGRVYHSDPLGLIADGLFDGARLSLASDAGTFSIGAFYTGLLYKDRANILMTDADRNLYARRLDYANAGTYFAPRRIVSSVGWEHLSLGGIFQASAALLFQFDLSGGGSPMHSQYLAAKLSLPGAVFACDAGGILELIEEGGGLWTALAAEIGIRYAPPGSFPQMLSLVGRISSGRAGGLAAFQPVTSKSQGGIFEAGLTGLSLVSLDYLIQPAAAFTASLTLSCFFRSDIGTYTAYPLSGKSDGRVLGSEFFGRLMWAPYSDLQMGLGGGAFLPSLGDANPGAEASWRVELNVIVSFL